MNAVSKILPDLTTLTQAQLIEMLVAQRAASERKLTLKVSPKGAVSLYGMGRFPVTLYGEQWERVIAHGDTILAFIKANAATVTRKA